MRSLRRTIRDALLASGLPAAADARRLRRLLHEPSEAVHHVLIAPPGGGNVGDQAMVQAFLENTSGPVVLVVSAADALRIPAPFADRVRVEPLPALLYGSGAKHRAAIASLAATLRSARTLSVVGADIMDGAYVPRASVARAAIARGAAA